jgi:hypothetical protein
MRRSVKLAPPRLNQTSTASNRICTTSDAPSLLTSER